MFNSIIVQSNHLNLMNLIDDESIQNVLNQESYWGMSTAINLYNCASDKITNPRILRRFASEICDFIQMKAFGEPILVRFGTDNKYGYTLQQLIETSNIGAHFAEDEKSAYIDIFSCAPYGPYATAYFCGQFFDAQKVVIAGVILR